MPDAAYFLSSGCEPLRSALGITSLLLPQVLASHVESAVGAGSPAIDLGNEIHWDDFDGDDKKLSAAAFMNHMSVMRVSCARTTGSGATTLQRQARTQLNQTKQHVLRRCTLELQAASAGHDHTTSASITFRASILLRRLCFHTCSSWSHTPPISACWTCPIICRCG